MLQEMRLIALDYLYHELGNEILIPNNLEEWFEKYSSENPGKIISYLIETIEDGKQVILFEPDSQNNDLINVSLTEVKNDSFKYPFVKPSSGNSPQIGPVMKLGYNPNTGFSPKTKILKQTLKKWKGIAESAATYSDYFQDIINMLERKELNIFDKCTINWESNKFNDPIDCFISQEGANYKGSLIVIKNTNGKTPGEASGYISYLQENLVKEKYTVNKIDRIKKAKCSLCNNEDVEVFPNGVKGAGINIGNVDREGSFSGLILNDAWKNYSICQVCADLLYIYKNHVLQKHSETKKRPYQTYVAGEPALIIPSISNDPENRQRIIKRVVQTVDRMTTKTDTVERRLWNILKTEKAILNVNIYWLTIGQVIGDLEGSVTDIPPTRLKELSHFNDRAREWENPIFPNIKIESLYSVDLSLNSLKDIFRRVGGKKVKGYNTSQKLLRLRRDIAKSVYHHSFFNEQRFWSEIMITAKTYLEDIILSGFWWGAVNEGVTDKGKTYLTSAGWVRHLAWWLYYFKQVGVMKMNKNPYQPKTDLLKPYFSDESGIDTYEKAFAFTLGILFGRLLTLQGAKGINVGANALTWLKRLTLKGSDLPELYVKTREKLLAYDAEGNKNVRVVIQELGHLGKILGDNIKLDNVPTNYFLLLGQSVSSEVIPTKSNEEK